MTNGYINSCVLTVKGTIMRVQLPLPRNKPVQRIGKHLKWKKKLSTTIRLLPSFLPLPGGQGHIPSRPDPRSRPVRGTSPAESTAQA
jgi:hypothetical protein